MTAHIDPEFGQPTKDVSDPGFGLDVGGGDCDPHFAVPSESKPAPMTAPLNLAVLKALHEAATKGEWKLDVSDYPPCEYAVIADAGDGRIVDVAACELDHTKPKGQQSPDAAFIVAAHTHWLELLAMAEAKDDAIDAANALGQQLLDERLARNAIQDVANRIASDWKKAEAEKAAVAERLEKALYTVAQLAPIYGLSKIEAMNKAAQETVEEIAKWVDEERRFDDRVDGAAIRQQFAAIAAHEAERGKE